MRLRVGAGQAAPRRAAEHCLVVLVPVRRSVICWSPPSSRWGCRWRCGCAAAAAGGIRCQAVSAGHRRQLVLGGRLCHVLGPEMGAGHPDYRAGYHRRCHPPAGVRTTADTWHGMELSWGNIFRFVGDTLSRRGLLWPVVLVVILCIAAFCFACAIRKLCCARCPLALPPDGTGVLALLRTHSIQHGWFTWRSLTVSIFAGLAFLYYSCGIRAGLRRLRGQKQQG